LGLDVIGNGARRFGIDDGVSVVALDIPSATLRISQKLQAKRADMTMIAARPDFAGGAEHADRIVRQLGSSAWWCFTARSYWHPAL
jgi:hypothetical protein